MMSNHIVANCPGISGDSPGFLTCVPEGSRKSALAQIVPEYLWLSQIYPEITTGVAMPPTSYDLGIDY